MFTLVNILWYISTEFIVATFVAITISLIAPFKRSITARNTMTADNLTEDFIKHENELKLKQAKQQEAGHRRTMQRVKARPLLKRSKTLRKAKLFAGLSDKAIGKLIDNMKGKTFAPGETLVQQGDVAYEFFVVTSGECKVVVNGKFVGSLRAHDHFGEVCVAVAARIARAKTKNDPRGSAIDAIAEIASSEQRTATVIADSNGEVQVLTIGISVLTKLFESGTLDANEMLSMIHDEQEKRIALRSAGRVWQLSGARSKLMAVREPQQQQQ